MFPQLCYNKHFWGNVKWLTAEYVKIAEMKNKGATKKNLTAENVLVFAGKLLGKPRLTRKQAEKESMSLEKVKAVALCAVNAEKKKIIHFLPADTVETVGQKLTAKRGLGNALIKDFFPGVMVAIQNVIAVVAKKKIKSRDTAINAGMRKKGQPEKKGISLIQTLSTRRVKNIRKSLSEILYLNSKSTLMIMYLNVSKLDFLCLRLVKTVEI